MAMTLTTAIISEISTSWMAPEMKTESSDETRTSTPGGIEPLRPSMALLTFSEICTALDCACGTMPRPMPDLPLVRRPELDEPGPKTTEATSLSLILSRITSSCISSGVLTSATARMAMFWLVPLSEPAGLSKPMVERALRTSATVSPRLASFTWSTSTWKTFCCWPLICTSATPGTAARRSAITSSASADSSPLAMLSEVTESCMMAWALESALMMVGVVAPSGRRLVMRLSASRTSEVALSRLVPSEKLSDTRLWP